MYLLILALFTLNGDDLKFDDLPTRFPAAERVVAIGDVHGDLQAARKALQLAGAMDEKDNWIGGKLVLVQTGDQLDRGDNERAIVDLFEKLRKQAAAAGGAFHVLNGNHELMNVALDLRYVTDGGYVEFQPGIEVDSSDPLYEKYPANQHARIAAMKPGGPYAMIFAQRNTVVMVGDSVFVHGGILPQHVDYGLRRINNEIRAWLRGETERPQIIRGSDSLVWSRHYSNDTDAEDCELLRQTLEKLGAKRIVVSHTVQRHGINSACDDQAWRIDVGMAAHYGGVPAVLEIVGDDVRVLN